MRPSLWVFDWRTPDAETVLTDTQVSLCARFNDGSDTPIEKQN